MNEDFEIDDVTETFLEPLADEVVPPPEIMPLGKGLGMLKVRDYQTECVDCLFEGWLTYDALAVEIATGLGKAQPLTAKVITSDGPVAMYNIEVGSEVIGSDGKPHKVTGVYPKGMKRVFRVRFSDGSSTRCCADHLWSVQTKSQKCREQGFQTVALKDLGNLQDADGANRFFIPVVEPVEFQGFKDWQIDPYLLGVLLGDGSFRNGRIQVSSADEFIVEQIKDRLPHGYSLKKVSDYDFLVASGTHAGQIGKLRSFIRECGLDNAYSHEKFVPCEYKYGSLNTRREILRGLMDTDGHIRPSDQHCEFNTTSRRLAEDVCEIVRSLGGCTRVRRKKPGNYTHNGEYRTGLESFRVTVTIQDNPFKLPRKADLFRSDKIQGRTKAIVAIEEDGEELCQCIMVDSSDHLYLTDDYILTHNTVIGAEVIIRHPGQGRILFIAHVVELIDQARRTIKNHTDEEPSVEMGDQSECRDGHGILDKSKVLVASIQTMSRRMEQFDPNDFDLIIIDEFHHAAADSYRRLWEYFKTKNPAIKLLGITATLFRTDKITLGCMADHCAFKMGIREGIDDGWLVPVKQKYIVVENLDFSACRTLAKDLNEKDLEGVMMGGKVEEGMTEEERRELLIKQERMLHAIAAPSVKEADGKPGLVFCVTVEHAIRMAEILRRYPGVTAEVVHGKTPKEDRKDTIRQFGQGKIQFLVGVGCFLEGFDAPHVQVLVMARPTKSLVIYIQMIGRGTRAVGGLVDKFDSPDTRKEAIAGSIKPFCTVLDFVGNSGKHKLISTADVFAGDMPPELVAAAIKEMKETGEAEDIRKKTWQKKEEHDAEVRRREEEKRQLEKERRERAIALEEARRARLVAEAEYRAKNVDPFGHESVPERVQTAYRGGATDGQVRFLVQLGIKEETAMGWGKGQAGAVIDKLSNQTGPDFVMRFGKHKGKTLKTIPHDYLKWASTEIKDPKFQDNLEVYRKQVIADRQKNKHGDAYEGD